MDGLNPNLTLALHGVIDAALGRPGISEELYKDFGHGNWKKMLNNRIKTHLSRMDEVIKAKAKGLPTVLTDENVITGEIINSAGIDPQLIQDAINEEPTEEEIRQGEAMAEAWLDRNLKPEAATKKGK